MIELTGMTGFAFGGFVIVCMGFFVKLYLRKKQLKKRALKHC